MGYGDIEPFGSTINSTPHLNRMAKEGMKLTSFYIGWAACTPSRASLMTGCYARRVGMDGRVCFPGEARGLNPDEITIADVLKTKGYATGCFGKWHLGDQPQFMPARHGFDYYYGIPYSNDMWRFHKLNKKYNFPPLPLLRNDDVVGMVEDGDGKDISALLFAEPGAKSPHEAFFYKAMGVRSGKWKFLTRGKGELYNLEEDIGEKNNIASRNPNIVKRMRDLLQRHIDDLEKNNRPAAFAENPKPILPHPEK